MIIANENYSGPGRMQVKWTKAFLLIVGMFSLNIGAFAGDIDKAFKYLNTGDYPNANKYLREVLQDEANNTGANYGMAKYFSSKDNKAYNIDSANIYIQQVTGKLPFNVEDKQTKKLLSLGVRDYTIQSIQKTINFDAYSAAEKQNTLEAYQYFIGHYTDKIFLEKATDMRNQKAYIIAMSLQTTAALADFIKQYPNATELKEAKERYEKLLYEQTTAPKTFQAYKKYLDMNPTGAYVTEAHQLYEEKLVEYYNLKHDLAAYIEFERLYKQHPALKAVQDSIYILATEAGSIEAFKNFVSNYPQNPHWSEAWDQLYLLYTAETRPDDYARFIANFPAYPNRERIFKDAELASKDLQPFEKGNKWGYVLQPTPDSIVQIIGFDYEEAFPFKYGLAAVRTQSCSDSCTYFYIDKKNQRTFNGEFNYAGDFEQGLAVVGLGNCETGTCKYGMINKRGAFVVPVEYDEIAESQEDLYLAAKKEKYGFIDHNGQTAISNKYTDALPFSMGLAAVALDGNWFFIDKMGAQKFINRFMDVSSFSDSLCAVTQDKQNWGYVDMTGNFVIEPKYESAEDFENGFAIISKKEKDPRNKSLFISQRYRINKSGKVIEKLTAPKAPSKKGGKKKGRR